MLWAGAAALAQQSHPPAIVSISVCSPTGAGGAGSCPSGSFDTQQTVLAPDGSGNPINMYGGLATLADEHSTIFPPGTFAAQSGYLFFVATRTNANPISSGLVALESAGPPDAKGRWTLDFAASFTPSQLFVSPVEHPQCPTVPDGNPAHQDQTFDLNYADPGTVLADPTNPVPGSLLMIYEGTTRCIGLAGNTNAGSSFYSTIAVATSLDYGHTWPSYRYLLGPNGTPQHPVPAQSPSAGPQQPAGASGNQVCLGNDCTAPPWPPGANYGRYAVLGPQVSIAAAMANPSANGGLTGHMGDSEPSAFADDVSSTPAQYVYEVHGYAPGPSALGNPPISPPYNLSSDVMIARAALNGGTAPLQFLKWNGTAFAEPGMGGLESPVFPVGSPKNCEGTGQLRDMGSIGYVEPAQQYLLVFVCQASSDPLTQAAGPGAAWFYSTSYDVSDPTQWSPPQEIAGSWSTMIPNSNGCLDFNGWYPSLMSLSTKAGHLSSTGFVFFMQGCAGDPNGNSNGEPPARVFSSRAFTITTGPAAPTISLVANAEGEAPTIAPNTWVEVKGANLAPAGDARIWQGSDFVNNKMPTQLDGVSATVNGKAAYIYYISPAQVNILTPPDAMTGAVAVQVTNNGVASAAFTAQAQAEAPSLFDWAYNGALYVAAVHSSGAAVGPASLSSSGFAPATPGETVMVYGNGFGPTQAAVVSGSPAQSGALSPLPAVKIGGVAATVNFAGLVAPGQFQFNVVVPASLADGDQPIVAAYGGFSTQSGTLISVQR
jgi:uncharacterized protein (TIGR03437 family)